MRTDLITIADIINFLALENDVVDIDPSSRGQVIEGPSVNGAAGAEYYGFCSSAMKNFALKYAGLSMGLLIIDEVHKHEFDKNNVSPFLKAVIFSKNARLDFIQVANRFFLPREKYIKRIESNVPASVELGVGVSIGENCKIGENVKIGNDTIIYSNVTLEQGTVIGERVVIKSGAVIGADGFGYEKNASGEWVKFPHYGGVVVENDVHIGANVTIDRGSLGNTILRSGVKVDNLVQISHNVDIGKNTVIIAGAVICGSVKIGENSWIAPNSCIRDGVTLGDRVFVGMGSVVNFSLPDQASSITISGMDAGSIRKFNKIIGISNKQV